MRSWPREQEAILHVKEFLVKKAKLVHDLNLDLTTRTARIVMIKFGRCTVNEFKT